MTRTALGTEDLIGRIASLWGTLRKREPGSEEFPECVDAAARFLLADSSDGAILTENGVVVYANARACALLRVADPRTVLGQPLAAWHDPADRRGLEHRHARLREGPSGWQRARLLGRDGKPVLAEVREVLLDEGRRRYVLGAYRPVACTTIVSAPGATETADDRLCQSTRMEMIGQIAGGIAHDFNNLLGGILGHASLMLTKLGPEHPAYGSLQTVLQTSRRAATLTDKLLQFARGGPVETAEVDVNGLVEESLGLIARPALAPITIARRLSPASPRFRGDAGQIHQVVMNLILNAADAMPEGGEMRIETGVLNFSDQDVIKHPEAAPGPYVYVEVADSGTGMPPEILHRIFDPFFTTKPPGKGTGLGLAMTYRIVQNHGGFITVESEPGEGSLFRVCFPQHGEERATAAVVAETSPAERTILFVDAQPEVRGAARSVLEVCGYRVLEAAGGAEAFEVFRKHAPRVDLVVLDIAGPEPDGETFRGLRALDPDVRVVLTAQAPLSEAAQGLLRDGAFGVLQKPYGMDAVLKVLHEAAQPSAAHA